MYLFACENGDHIKQTVTDMQQSPAQPTYANLVSDVAANSASEL